MRTHRKRKSQKRSRVSLKKHKASKQVRRLACEILEDRRMLSVDAYPDLDHLELIHPRAGQFEEQIVYLNFDGAENVTYNGPVVIEGIDIPAFKASDNLAGQEQEIIEELVTRLEQTFAHTGISFTTTQPTETTQYSTIYLGGDDSAFAEYGTFQGLAEKVDLGNVDKSDNAFVFSSDQTQVIETTIHEVGHLLGYGHPNVVSKIDSGSTHYCFNDVALTYNAGLGTDVPEFGMELLEATDGFVQSMLQSVIDSGETLPNYDPNSTLAIHLDYGINDTRYLFLYEEIPDSPWAYDLSFGVARDPSSPGFTYRLANWSTEQEMFNRAEIVFNAVAEYARLNYFHENFFDDMFGMPLNVAKVVLFANQTYEKVNSAIDWVSDQIVAQKEKFETVYRDDLWNIIYHEDIEVISNAVGISEAELRDFIDYDYIYTSILGGQASNVADMLNSKVNAIRTRTDGFSAVEQVKAETITRSVTAFLQASNHGASNIEAIKAAVKGGSRQLSQSAGTLAIGLILAINDSTGLPEAASDFSSAVYKIENMKVPFTRFLGGDSANRMLSDKLRSTEDIRSFIWEVQASLTTLKFAFQDIKSGSSKINWTINIPGIWETPSSSEAVAGYQKMIDRIDTLQEYWAKTGILFGDHTHTVNASSGSHGNIKDTNGNVITSVPVSEGDNFTFKADADAGYIVDRWYLEGSPIPATEGAEYYTLKGVYNPVSVKVKFRALSSSNLVIDRPAGTSLVTGDSSVFFSGTAPYGTHHVSWHNALTNENSDTGSDDINSINWDDRIYLDLGVNHITFKAWGNAAGTQLLSTESFSAERNAAVKTKTFGKDDIDKMCFVLSGSSSSSYCGESIFVGFDDQEGREYGFIRFDLSDFPALPAGAEFISASLKGEAKGSQSIGSDSLNVRIQWVTADWTQPTWNNQPPTTAYNISKAVGLNDVVNWDVSDIVKKWYSGSTNYGFRLHAPTALGPSHHDRYFEKTNFELHVSYALESKPPRVDIDEPTQENSYWTSNNLLNLEGSAYDSDELDQVTWQNHTTGVSSNTVIDSVAVNTYWSADIPLQAGLNLIEVQAEDASGNKASDFLDVFLLTAPSGLTATDNLENQIQVSWDRLPHGDYFYQVERSESEHGAKTVIQGWSQNLVALDRATDRGIDYYYWVKTATDASGANATEVGNYSIGTEGEPSIQASPVPLLFSLTDTGQSSSRTLSIHNPGDSSLVVSELSGLSSAFKIMPENKKNDSSDDIIIPQGKSFDVSVIYTPNSQDLLSETLVIYSDAGNQSELNVPVSVADTADPTVTIDTAYIITNEGTAVTNSGSFSDSDVGDNVVISASIGSITQDTGNSGAWNWSYPSIDDIKQNVIITASDRLGGVATSEFQLLVNNVAPVASAGTSRTVDGRDPVSFHGTFTDVGIADTHSIEWDFGDGSTSTSTLSPTHTFMLGGIFTVIVTITDDDGGSSSHETLITVDNLATPTQKSSIQGIKWNDIDGDGVKDQNEPGLAGVTIYLDLNYNGQKDTGEPTTITVDDNSETAINETGQWAFLDLAPGVYSVAEVTSAGWLQTYPVSSPHHQDPLAKALFEGYKAGEGTPSPGGAVLSQANTIDGNPWTSGHAYRYLDGWNHAPRVPQEQYDGIGETEWVSGGHANTGTAIQGWASFDNTHPEYYAFDFSGYEYDHTNFELDSASPRHMHEDRWYDGTGQSWIMYDIRDPNSPEELASGTLNQMHLDIDFDDLNVEGSGVLSVDPGNDLYTELLDRWGTSQLFINFNSPDPPSQSENWFEEPEDTWAIFGSLVSVTPVPTSTHTVLLDSNQHVAGINFGNQESITKNSQFEISINADIGSTVVGDKVQQVPESQSELHEWETVTIDVWVTLPEITSVTVSELNFAIKSNSWFYSNPTITQALGVSNLSTEVIEATVSSSMISLSSIPPTAMLSDGTFLLAQVQYEPTAILGQSLTILAGDNYFSVIEDDGFSLRDTSYELSDSKDVIALAKKTDESSLYPMIYDIDNNGSVGLTDLSRLVNLFGETVDVALPYSFAADFDQNGVIGLTDLSRLVNHFGYSQNSHGIIVLPDTLLDPPSSTVVLEPEPVSVIPIFNQDFHASPVVRQDQEPLATEVAESPGDHLLNLDELVKDDDWKLWLIEEESMITLLAEEQSKIEFELEEDLLEVL